MDRKVIREIINNDIHSLPLSPDWYDFYKRVADVINTCAGPDMIFRNSLFALATLCERQASHYGCEDVPERVDLEIMAASEKWGEPEKRKDAPWLAILMEEVGEVARSLLGNPDSGNTTDELLQVAAVCEMWLEIL